MDKHTIRVEIKFRAGHRLLPPYKGKCNNVHGEGYTAIVEIMSNKLDENGMVCDFGDVKKKIKEWIDINWDHAYIHNGQDEIGIYLKEKGFKTYNMTTNSVGLHNPTAECMAELLYNVIKFNIDCDVIRVGIVESFEDSIAYYEEDR